MFLIDPRLLQNTPGELSLTIREALGHISRALPYFINTTPMPGCVPLSCYGNVDRYVSQQGGCREEGWIVYEGWDGRYLKLITIASGGVLTASLWTLRLRMKCETSFCLTLFATKASGFHAATSPSKRLQRLPKSSSSVGAWTINKTRCFAASET